MFDLNALIRQVKDWWLPFNHTPTARFILKWGRRIFVLGILAYMVFKFSEIGWGKLFFSLPVKIWFYLIYIPLFLILPFSEIFIYRILWDVPRKKLWTALLVKKVFNHDILGYSGEVFLYWWARQYLSLKDSRIVRDIKDNNVISVVVSMLATLTALLLFLSTNPDIFTQWFRKVPNGQWIFVGISILIIVGLIYKFRKRIFSLPLKTTMGIFSIHLVRHLAVFILQVYQWHVVLPGVPMYVWFTFMAVLMTVTRLPFLPNVDLLFLSISINLTKTMGVPVAGVMAVLTINSVLDRVLHFFIFIYYQGVIRRKEEYAHLNPEDLASLTLNESNTSQ